MKSVSVSIAKNTLSALLRRVKAGMTITITDRGVPVASLVPPAPTRGVSPRMLDLARRGLMRLPRNPLSADWLDLPRPKLKGGASVVTALLEERASGW